MYIFSDILVLIGKDDVYQMPEYFNSEINSGKQMEKCLKNCADPVILNAYKQPSERQLCSSGRKTI
jgi:hypothetical protein